MEKIILASKSKPRAALLQRLKLKFSIIAADIDESLHENELIDKYVSRLSFKKANYIFKQYPEHIVIGGDQALVFENNIYGKPKNKTNAIEMLTKFSDKQATFYTGMCVLAPNHQPIQKIALTHIKFNKLTEQEIIYYLEQDEPYESAGSFKCESLGICLAQKITSDDPSAILGLSLIQINQAFKQIGIELLS